MKLEKKLDKKKKTKSIQRKDKHISKSINETWDRIFITIIIFYGKKERKRIITIILGGFMLIKFLVIKKLLVAENMGRLVKVQAAAQSHIHRLFSFTCLYYIYGI